VCGPRAGEGIHVELSGFLEAFSGVVALLIGTEDGFGVDPL